MVENKELRVETRREQTLKCLREINLLRGNLGGESLYVKSLN